ncbi:hypothetical protein XENOCAPTIV_026127, partial [Xenoophorus captivus]
VTKKQVAVKSTRGIALKNSHSLMVKTGPSGGGVGPSPQGGKPGQQGQPGGGAEYAPKNTRLFFDGEESCYIIDAKLEGNLGRYLNKLFSFGGFGCFLVFWNIFSMFYYPAVLNRQSGCFATIWYQKLKVGNVVLSTGGWELPPEEMRGLEREEREQEKIKDMTGSTTE